MRWWLPLAFIRYKFGPKSVSFRIRCLESIFQTQNTAREILVTPRPFPYLLKAKNDELPVKFVNKIKMLFFFCFAC